jgi:hypothetical protein
MISEIYPTIILRIISQSKRTTIKIKIRRFSIWLIKFIIKFSFNNQLFEFKINYLKQDLKIVKF